MKKGMSLAVACLLSIGLFGGIASAHVTVWPKEVEPGAYEKFAVRVPSEEEATPTVKVEVRIPEEATVSRVEPKPGWTYELATDDTGKVTSVTWTAEGDGLSPTEFAEFYMSGRVGEQAESLVWKAYQSYGDGTVVEWVGAEDAEKPASVTTVRPSGGGESAAAGETGLPLYLSIAALAVACLALVVSFARKPKAGK
ncbi:YcnI family protein [Paenibacillus antri]|uniref:YcnI family protein n=1 Tax=Paenibacillus antri TaxID=2582848 RepID=A0A5R9G5C5_9BACL|nr:YcnI family protein [Paenibacillus antri]TLS51562.1 YcnI family protein [Paenibacillus antri]